MSKATLKILTRALTATELASIVSATAREVEVVHADRDEADRISMKAGDALGWGGFRAGHGGWFLQKNYRPIQGDWNDPSSEHHY